MPKPRFDPNQPFEVAQVEPGAKPKFDPSKPFEAAAETAAPGALEAGLRGGAQGLTLGYSDELTGAVRGAWDALTSKEKLLDAYRKHRDEARAANEAARQANGGAYLAGEIGGGLASLAIPGAAGIKGMAALGAATALGSGQSDLTRGEVGGAALETAAGGLLGGALGKGSQLLGRGVNAIGGKIGGRLAALENKAAEKVGERLASEGSSLSGALGAETQKGSRFIENLLRAKDHVAPAEREAIEGFLSSPGAKDLLSGVTQNTLEAAPGQISRIGAAKQALSSFQETLPEALKSGTAEAIGMDTAKRQVMDRVKRYAVPLAAGSAAEVLLPDEMSSAAKFGVGALAGRGVSPTVQALMRMAQNPAVQTQALRGAGWLLGKGAGAATGVARGSVEPAASGVSEAASRGYAKAFPNLRTAMNEEEAPQ